jgi:xylan 1,4-beta-xylosidase
MTADRREFLAGSALAGLSAACGLAAAKPQAAEAGEFPVKIQVDTGTVVGEMRPVWRFVGYDEPNYTYLPDGKKLLSQLAALSPHPVVVRTHNLLTTGDGTPALKWGSTNAYTEDANGRPVYDWTIVDRIFDTLREHGMKPLVEIGFMPEALSVKPEPYRHSWKPGDNYNRIYTGWAYPPKDYGKWAELVYQWAKHCVERYGRSEVETWYWETWNEPNIGYWRGTPEEYHKLHDIAADAVRRALPAARVGGPHSTGPGAEQAARFLRNFLEHCLRGRNHATGKTGSPLDFVGFHAKGSPRFVDGHVRMGPSSQMRDIDRGFEIVTSFPELRDKPIIIGESDPDGCAACSARVYPQNGYRNGVLYASYTAATFARKYLLADRHKANFEGAVTWAFQFEGEPYFDGFRALASRGIELPVLNVFRMFGRMRGQRVKAESTADVGVDTLRRRGVREAPDVAALASRHDREASVLVWHYHDDDVPGPAAAVELSLGGLPADAGRVLLHHYRIDENHSNAYTVWKSFGSPQQPTAEQYARLERAARLAPLSSPEWVKADSNAAVVRFTLPRQAVSLLTFAW